MKLYNSLTRKVEDFITNKPGVVKMYTCGPTVYDYAHLGNYRSYIFEDILEKSLEYIGYKVNRVMNITDIGHLTGDSDAGKDKMLEKAKEENKGILDIAAFYTKAFKDGFDDLNLKWPDTVIPATSCIDTYIEIIKKLLEKEYAYQSGGNIYFDISKLKKYNVFSNQESEEMMVGVRDSVSDDENKRNPGDFALWFTKSKFENQALKWNSPWGEGYPGWHIECSGISYKYLGEYLDIHCGGIDNKFPHHTNEIAQSESFIGHKWCNYWFHVLHLNLKNGKMSKSDGSFVTINDLKKLVYNPLSYKLMCLQSSYRKELVFSFDALNSSQTLYNKILNKVNNLKEDGKLDEEAASEYNKKFKECIENDLNTAMMITTLLDVIKSNLNNTTKIYLLKEFDKVLCLDLFKKEQNIDVKLEAFILERIEQRNEAKKNKNYALADQIREELLENGVELLDTREGTKYTIRK